MGIEYGGSTQQRWGPIEVLILYEQYVISLFCGWKVMSSKVVDTKMSPDTDGPLIYEHFACPMYKPKTENWACFDPHLFRVHLPTYIEVPRAFTIGTSEESPGPQFSATIGWCASVHILEENPTPNMH